MAEAYARRSGKIGVVLTIPGPGLTNALTGLLEAYSACTSLLLVTAIQPSRSQPLPHDKLFHGLDHVSVSRPISGHSASIASRLDFEVEMKRSFATLEAGRPRPVMLEIDIAWMRRKDDFEFQALEPVRPEVPRQEDLDRVATLISQSRRGLIIGGRGVLAGKADGPFAILAERLNMPVLTTTLGKGAISEHHRLHMGKLYESCCRQLISDADLIIAVGCRFSQVDTDDWQIPMESTTLIHIDAEGKVLHNEYRADVALVADLRLFLEALTPLLDFKKDQSWALDKVSAQVTADRGQAPFLVACFNEILNKEDTIIVDVHEEGYPMVEHMRMHQGTNFLFPGLSLTLGYGIPAAIGARFAAEQGQVVCFCGDGGFLMSCQELATVAKYNLDILFVVVDDSAYGTIKKTQTITHGKAIGVDIKNPRFDLFVQSFGFTYREVDSLLKVPALIRHTLSESGPRVLVIPKKLLPN
jgi:acetolactate synthase-1/2/3 large subunit